MSSRGHLATAESHRAEAEYQGRQARNAGSLVPGAPSDGQEEEYLARMHEEHARQHELAAARIVSAVESECEGVSASARQACPLSSLQVTSYSRHVAGVVVHLDKQEEQAAALALMRCHHAQARVGGFKGMDSCPLHLPHTEVRAVGTDDIGIFSLDPSKTPPSGIAGRAEGLEQGE